MREIVGKSCVRENGAGFRGQRVGVAIVITCADVREDERARVGAFGCAGGVLGGGVAVGRCQRGFPFAERRFMDQHICVVRQRDDMVAGACIAEDRDDPPRLWRSDEGIGSQHAAIGQCHRITAFELAVDGACGHTDACQRGDVERPGRVVFDDAIAVTGDAVMERQADHGELMVGAHDGGFGGACAVWRGALRHAARWRNFVDAQRIGQMRLTGGQRGFDERSQAGGAVHIQRAVKPRERAAAQYAGQAKDVIAVQVRDEHLFQLGQRQRGTHDLMLGGFTAVEQPKRASFLEQGEGNRCDVSGLAWQTGTRAEKQQIHPEQPPAEHCAGCCTLLAKQAAA